MKQSPILKKVRYGLDDLINYVVNKQWRLIKNQVTFHLC